jgi:ABC-type polysaccharide/polyol phosphate export permease
MTTIDKLPSAVAAQVPSPALPQVSEPIVAEGLARAAADGPSPVAEPADGEAPAPTAFQTFHEMVFELVHFRELLWQMVLRDLRLRYKQAVMGCGWAIFMPLLIVGSGFLVKYAMAQVAGESTNAPGISGMTIKALGWAFFVGAVGFAVNSLTGNINLVTKIYFPREVFPLSAVVTQIFDSLIGSVGVAAVLLVFARLDVSLDWLWALPLVLLLVLFTAGAALLLSCANVFFRDVKYIVQVLLTFGIFFTPVFYEPQFFGPTGCKLMMLNPLAPLLDGLRLAIVENHNLLSPLIVSTAASQEILAWTPWYLAYSAAWSLLGFFGAWWLFHKLEFVYAEYI